MSTLTRVELIQEFCDKLNISKKQANILLQDCIDGLIECLQQHQHLKLSPLGNFSCKYKQARPGRNPRTGDPAVISARYNMVFKPSAVLLAKLNKVSESSNNLE